MTSPARGGPDTAGMRGEAAVARIHLAAWLKGNTSNPDGDAWRPADVFAAADELLPVVQRLAVEKAAEELLAAAEFNDRSDEEWTAYKHAAPSDPRRANPHSEGMADAYDSAVDYLRDRADALAAAAQPTDGRTGE